MKEIFTWAKKHNYVLDTQSYERYIIDYWTTCNESKFVTEILIQVSRK